MDIGGPGLAIDKLGQVPALTVSRLCVLCFALESERSGVVVGAVLALDHRESFIRWYFLPRAWKLDGKQTMKESAYGLYERGRGLALPATTAETRYICPGQNRTRTGGARRRLG